MKSAGSGSDHQVKHVNGKDQGDAFQEPIAVARSLEEFEAFNKVISSWEREYLLLNV